MWRRKRVIANGSHAGNPPPGRGAAATSRLGKWSASISDE